MAYLDNGSIQVGVDLDQGGSIGFLLMSGRAATSSTSTTWAGGSASRTTPVPGPSARQAGLEGLALEPGRHGETCTATPRSW